MFLKLHLQSLPRSLSLLITCNTKQKNKFEKALSKSSLTMRTLVGELFNFYDYFRSFQDYVS